MKKAIEEFFDRNAAAPGLIAMAVQHADKSSVTRKYQPEMADESLENAWRCMLETMPVLKLNHFPTARFRWIYENALIHCECRKDGSCLGIFAAKESGQFNELEVDRLVAEFHSL